MQKVVRVLGKALVFVVLVSMCSCFYTGDVYTIPSPYQGVNSKDPGNNPFAGVMQSFPLEAPMLFETGQQVVQLNITRGASVSYARALTGKFGLKASAGAASYRGKVNEHTPMYVHVQTYDNGIIIDESDTWLTAQFEGDREQTQLYADVAAGWFTGSSRGIHHEVYTGMGMGKERTINDLFYSLGGSTSIAFSEEERSFLHPFLQHNLSYRTKRISLSWMNRASMIHYMKQTLSQPLNQNGYGMLATGWLYSSGLRLAAGSPLIRGFAQIEFAIPFGKRDMEWLRNRFSVGVVLDFGRPD